MSGSKILTLHGKNEIQAAVQQLKITDKNNIFASSHWFMKTIDGGHISQFKYSADDEIEAAFHVKRVDINGLNIVEMAGEPFIQYNDILNLGCSDVDEFLDQSLVNLKQKKIQAVHLHNVRADGNIYDYCCKNGVILNEKKAPCLSLVKFENFDDYFKSLGQTSRKTFRRLFNRFECDYACYVDDEITQELVKQVVGLKQVQLKHIGQTSRVFMSDENLTELTKIIATKADDYKTVLSTLKCDGVIVSAAISFVKNDTYFGYIIAMDMRFSKYKVGNIQMLLNIKWAFEHKLTNFDLLSPGDDYKLRWTKNDYVKVADFLIPLNIWGKIFVVPYFKIIRPMLKRLYMKFRC